ncbi:MAG TPA: NAD-glutamate dehydrogenase, partial [Streptomyces sp.]|nr:NAD-glutamate dehydrogenase [Streptomyces sp.]
MQTKLEEAKAERLSEAARVAEESPAGGQHPARGLENGALRAFLQRYYLHTAPEDLTDRDPVDILGAAFAHYRLAQDRPQGTANVRVHTPSIDENGWTCTHTVVEVVTDDMPFLVDSVTNELSRQHRGIHVVIHPQMIVRRDVAGKLLEVLDAGRDKLIPGPGQKPAEERELPHDAVTESWIHVEIDRETERDDLKEITEDLRRVLSDVREAVEDWRKMRDAALRIADELESEPIAGDVLDQEIKESRELLRWLADDHFTFLGYREYELSDEATDPEQELTLTPVAGSGLGILRSDPQHTAGVDGPPVSPSFSRLPHDARAKAREHRLLVLT